VTIFEETTMLVEDCVSVEAEVDQRNPSRLQIDVRVHPVNSGSFNPDAGEMIERAIREGFRDAFAQAHLERLVLASNPQPKRRGWLGRILGFFVCVGLGSVATLALTASHPRPRAVAGLEAPESAAASPGSQSTLSPAPPQSAAPANPAESQPGPGTFGLHEQ
jgi:hypothetical protein